MAETEYLNETTTMKWIVGAITLIILLFGSCGVGQQYHAAKFEDRCMELGGVTSKSSSTHLRCTKNSYKEEPLK